jgi:hypothetical protein
MTQVASEDADYRRQLVDLAATRGGLYWQALARLHGFESEKLGPGEAGERGRLDRERFAAT